MIDFVLRFRHEKLQYSLLQYSLAIVTKNVVCFATGECVVCVNLSFISQVIGDITIFSLTVHVSLFTSWQQVRMPPSHHLICYFI